MGKLVAKALEGLPAGKHWDGNGLFLQVTKGGSRTWVVRYTLRGKTREMGLGAYPAVTLKQARIKVTETRAEIAQGIDPLAEKRKKQAAERATKTFREVAEEYFADQRPGWSKRHADEWLRSLKRDVFPTLGSLNVCDIDRATVLRAIKPLWTTKPVTGSRVLNRVETLLDAARAKGLRDGDNPARWKGDLQYDLPTVKREIAHYAAMDYRQVPELMAELQPLPDIPALALRLLILTATRTGETIAAQWSEIDLEAATWTIPGRRMKARSTHTVPLSVQAIEVLKILEQYRGSGGADWLFPGWRRGRPINDRACWRLLRELGHQHASVHGFRSAFRDFAAEQTSFPAEVCETALAHTAGSRVELAYRRTKYFEKRRELMQAWATFATMEPEGNVILVDQRRAG
jgi:integrase